MATGLSGKSKFALCIFMASVFCFSIRPAMAGTVQVYAKFELPLTLPFGVHSGTYEAVTKVFSVAAYSQLRFYASIASGSTVNATILATDSTGTKIYGLLGGFELNAASPAGSSASVVFDCPGQYVVINFTSSEASSVNTAIFGFQP